MMTLDLIEKVKEIGGELRVEGNQLKYRLPSGSERLVELIREKKMAIVTALTRPLIKNDEDYMNILRKLYVLARRIEAGEESLLKEYDELERLVLLYQGLI
ncbi:hypothetical protein H1164_13090 [Thermoactinomyces daqus]|uniref:TubC N-terminal docking domain-containing protein n=1 Tax=Thermoactinomyces daqus TaxID=1329516 RepID=A0A7W2AJE4_9BACL|nr:hypothetical protein [Thermoactinomyces daqus]MBA4543823.1 hypothetical protein [Thermoactinomyces daqus]